MKKYESMYQGSSKCRLDVFVSEICNISRSHAVKVINEGFVLLNGEKAVKKANLVNGDRVEVTLPDPVSATIEPENIPLNIVYEDNDLLVVDKPKGMVVHPAPGNYSGTLVNALMWHCGKSLSGINGVLRPGILHRIDKNTSGLLIVAKNDSAHNFLAEQIAAHSFTREYEAIVYGGFNQACGTVDAPIGRHPIKRKQMAVINTNSKPAVTHYEVINDYGKFSHLLLKLETGRTHQIRVHMAYIGHPVAGDDVYGPKKVITKLNGQCLHAKKIGFIHPTTKKYIEFSSELPEYFTDFLEEIKNN